MNRRNATVIILALVLMAAGFLGVLFIGQFINPPLVSIAIAVVDIPAGTVLTQDMIAVDNVQMNPKVVEAMVRDSDLAKFIGGTVVEPIHVYQPVPKAAISVEGNPASANRLALGLSDPDQVAMVVPVTQQTAPDAIVEGDFIDLSFGVGSVPSLGSKLSTEPTEAPFVTGYGGFIELTLPPIETALPTPTPTIEPLLMLPVAKTIVSNAKVLAVIREQRTDTVQDKEGVKTVTVAGKVIALVVAIPREAQELLQFSIDNGTVRVALLSAQLGELQPGERQPTLGMTWNDLVSLVRMERDESLAQGLPTQVIGPGAYAVEATRNAATQAVIALTSTAIAGTSTPTPISTQFELTATATPKP